MISRRRIVIGISVAACPGFVRAWPAWAGSTPHIGFISANDASGASPYLKAVLAGLKNYGYTEPATLQFDALYADDTLDRIPDLLDELERRRVDVIVTHAAATPIVVKGVRTIPVVYEFSADPVLTGIAADLAHPLLNSTGVTLLRAELNGKRLEILHEIQPKIRRVAVIANPLHAGEVLERADLETKARQLGIELTFFSTPNKDALEQALTGIAADLPQAIVAFSEGFVVENRHRIIAFATDHGIPVVSGWAIMARSGALITYGPRLVEAYSRTAYFVDRILRGAKPADLPIEQPTVLELIVNVKAAKVVGLDVPTSLLARADEVIE